MRRAILFVFLSLSLSVFSKQLDNSHLHPIEYSLPSTNFFEGALLGNGGMGVVVVSRPDAIVFHIGHNNVWDIRVAEDNKEKIGTFKDIFAKAKALPKDLRSIWDDKEFSDYLNMTADNYRKPYPRPFPCGTLILGIDRRDVEVLGHRIDISTGLCEVYLLREGKKNTLQIFVNSESDSFWFRLVDDKMQLQPSCFKRVRLVPDPYTPQDIPAFEVKEDLNEGLLSFYQVLPYQEPHIYKQEIGHPKDKAFKVEAVLSSPLYDGVSYTTQGLEVPLNTLEKYIKRDAEPFVGFVSLTEGLASEVKTITRKEQATSTDFDNFRIKTTESWKSYWSKSGISLNDDFLEKIWYWNLYFLNASIREEVTCPGLFANWSYGNIGTAWHGDYHLNYNTQQPFWVTYSSNHLEKNLPYVDLVDHLLPISKQWAKEYYGMRGAFFPHSAYPVDMTLHPYPVPDWGWEVFETPWTVQGLWWHYIYSMDVDFLKERAFQPIKEAVLFLVDYMKRPEAKGEAWGDDKYHIFPSVPPELYGLQPGFKYNYDTQIDITLSKFIFKAYIEAVETLKYDKIEAALIRDVKEILNNLPEYSTTKSDKYGEIFTSVPEEEDKIVYNVPATLTHVFPGEEFGIHTTGDMYDKLVNTYRAHQNEGGNDIVFLNLQAARLGLLDLNKFKRQVNYALLPNKTATDIVLQSGGRYSDFTDFAYMGKMGIWFENFALPVVINECLMQSYTGVINLFPNWDKSQDASFSTLRAVGAFLVSAQLKNGEVEIVNILSEKGKVCKLKNPWGEERLQVVRNGKKAEKLVGDLLTIKTSVGEMIEISRLK